MENNINAATAHPTITDFKPNITWTCCDWNEDLSSKEAKKIGTSILGKKFSYQEIEQSNVDSRIFVFAHDNVFDKVINYFSTKPSKTEWSLDTKVVDLFDYCLDTELFYDQDTNQVFVKSDDGIFEFNAFIEQEIQKDEE